MRAHPVLVVLLAGAEGRSQSGGGMAVRRDAVFARAASGSCESQVARWSGRHGTAAARATGHRSRATAPPLHASRIPRAQTIGRRPEAARL